MVGWSLSGKLNFAAAGEAANLRWGGHNLKTNGSRRLSKHPASTALKHGCGTAVTVSLDVAILAV